MTAKSSVFHIAVSSSSVPAPVAVDAEAVAVACPFTLGLHGERVGGLHRSPGPERELEGAQHSQVCISERSCALGACILEVPDTRERREDRVVDELVGQGLVHADREESQEHDEVVGEVAGVLEALGAEPLPQLEDERSSLVALVEEIVADVRVARRLGASHRVEVERARVGLLQRAQLHRLGARCERLEQERGVHAVAPRDLGASPRAAGRRLVRVREHVHEGAREGLPACGRRGDEAQNRRSPGCRNPKPASCLRTYGSSVASIWSSRASGGSTKRSWKVGIDVSRKIASASSAVVRPDLRAAATSASGMFPTFFARISTRTAKSLRYTSATISSFPAEKRLAMYLSGARAWSTFDTDGMAAVPSPFAPSTS